MGTNKLTQREKDEAIRKLTEMKGCLKGRGKISDEEAGELAMREIAKKFGIKID
jgi:hypothetical protein